jgi:phosphate transport system substrate-binding protein
MKKNILIAFSVTALIIISGCSKKKENIQVAGSSTVLPVVSKAAEKFKEIYGINIIVNAGGSGVGVNQIGEENIDIGMASRDITEAERVRYPNTKLMSHSIGKDAVVPVVSSEIYDSGVQALTLEQIGKIYKGEISNWKMLGGPDRNILVIDKEGSRGTRHVFMEVVLGDKEAKAAGADLVLGSNNEEQTALVQSNTAIGMLSNAWLNKDIKGLSITMADNSVVEPTLENIINGKFPITRNLLLITNGKPEGKIKAFIDFILSPQGQKLVTESGYVSLVK